MGALRHLAGHLWKQDTGSDWSGPAGLLFDILCVKYTLLGVACHDCETVYSKVCLSFSLEKVHEMEKEHLNKVQTANEVKARKLRINRLFKMNFFKNAASPFNDVKVIRAFDSLASC